MSRPVEDPAARITELIAGELAAAPWQVRAAVDLLDGGATVPFIARYRKEATGSLDDAQLRTLTERLHYLRELGERRGAIVEAITAQGKMTGPLATAIAESDTKARLEDIYLPYRTKRRTKAQIAREAGLEPLADLLLNNPLRDPSSAATAFVATATAVPDTATALIGARSILAERFGEDPDLVGELRDLLWQRGAMFCSVRSGAADAKDAAKFSDYFDFSEPLKRLPSHRILAIFRGEAAGVLSVGVRPDPAQQVTAGSALSDFERRVARRFGIGDRGRPGDRWLLDSVQWAWRTRILPSLTVDVRTRLRQSAERDAAAVFAANLKDLLLAAPAGSRTILGLDPGFRTGVKVAVVDGTGKAVATETIYPHQPANRWEQALTTLQRMVTAHGVELVAIGNGTASRETDRLATELGRRCPGLTTMVVSEAGASVYSASAWASRELPDLDVSLRGAVSIARRLQDPLAELVKIDPKAIGVGQYQHDLTETILAKSLDAVVEDCVNAVGVEVNTASVPLLTRVSGMSAMLAENLVAYRDANGPFRVRRQLKDVPRLGAKAYQQCAGFLRIVGGDDPLDTSSVHPEAYSVVRRVLQAAGGTVRDLIGNTAVLHGLSPEAFTDDTFGLPTVTDIIAELEKPGRDPRPAFVTATFAAGVEKINDLRVGMVLQGVVTNVAAFGAFVDVGVHQDGLVHISAMSRTFVSDPRQVVTSGQVVTVKVIQIDEARKRISLTLRLDDEPGAVAAGASRAPAGRPQRHLEAEPQRHPETEPHRHPEAEPRRRPEERRSGGGTRPQPRPPTPGGAMAEALRRAGLGH